MNPKAADPAFGALDKSTRAATPNVPPSEGTEPRSVSRRTWLGLSLAGTAAAAAEAASLAGAWDHRSLELAPSSSAPSATASTAGVEPASSAAPPAGAGRLLHVGHCCHLLEIAGQRWLTDPWFFNPAFGALTHQSALAAHAVGPLDGIFISHRHPDHFDPSALRALDRGAKVWTPDESLVGPLRELGFTSVALSQPWQTLQQGSLAVSFVPALHDVPQHSLVLAGPEARVLFCADTGFHGHWAEIRRRYQPLTALLPSDGTRLRWEPRLIMTPEEAARAALELGCPQILQTHADATYTDPIARYVLSETEPAPLERLERALKDRVAFKPLHVGETRALASATSTTI
jgi:L-ascorbate metabolism protein UlaG (beta-lactamase superfamily)